MLVHWSIHEKLDLVDLSKASSGSLATRCFYLGRGDDWKEPTKEKARQELGRDVPVHSHRFVLSPTARCESVDEARWIDLLQVHDRDGLASAMGERGVQVLLVYKRSRFEALVFDVDAVRRFTGYSGGGGSQLT